MGRVYLSPLLKRGDILKVPIKYKSSDRYNAGVDVVYNDGSKLQFAPFIYATTQSGDNGGDSGDEEGEETMVVIFDSTTMSIDKSFNDLVDAVKTGKIVVLKKVTLDDESRFVAYIAYLTRIENQNAGEYYAYFSIVVSDDSTHELNVIKLTATNGTDNMVMAKPS